jgi:hypothetical protein
MIAKECFITYQYSDFSTNGPYEEERIFFNSEISTLFATSIFTKSQISCHDSSSNTSLPHLGRHNSISGLTTIRRRFEELNNSLRLYYALKAYFHSFLGVSLPTLRKSKF